MVGAAVILTLVFFLGVGFTCGAFAIRRMVHRVVGGDERIDSDITTLGGQERAITGGITDSVDAVTGITAQIEHHITTVSGMGDDLQQLNNLLERIQKRNRTTASGVAGTD